MLDQLVAVVADHRLEDDLSQNLSLSVLLDQNGLDDVLEDTSLLSLAAASFSTVP